MTAPRTQRMTVTRTGVSRRRLGSAASRPGMTRPPPPIVQITLGEARAKPGTWYIGVRPRRARPVLAASVAGAQG
jgi:hypothetical protein